MSHSHLRILPYDLPYDSPYDLPWFPDLPWLKNHGFTTRPSTQSSCGGRKLPLGLQQVRLGPINSAKTTRGPGDGRRFGSQQTWPPKSLKNGYGSPIDTFLVGWTSIYQLFWGSLGTRVLTHPQMAAGTWAKHSKTRFFSVVKVWIEPELVCSHSGSHHFGFNFGWEPS